MHHRSLISLLTGLVLGGLLHATPAAAQLSADGTLLLQQGVDGLQDFRSTDDRFGLAFAWGDFDGDGFADLAIGVPDEDVTGTDNGIVQVVYGGAGGLTTDGDQRLIRIGIDDVGLSNDNDRMGDSLAAGDFDADGFDDLAIGVPGDVVNGEAGAGSVIVLHGSAGGLATTGAQLWNQDTPDVFGVAEAGDGFGSALAAGDFDDSGGSDLAIGAPFEALGDVSEAGFVIVLMSGQDGLTAVGVGAGRGSFGGPPADEGDRFAAALATGDLDDDGFDDLAIGAPGIDTTALFAGEVFVLLGSVGGIHPDVASLRRSIERNEVLCRPTGEHDVAGVFDRFGSALAIGDFDDDGRGDLAVGIPGALVSGQSRAGQVDVLFSGVDVLSGDAQCLSQDVPGIGGVQPDELERFGASLAAGDVSADRIDDLVIGVPGESLIFDGAIGGLHQLLGSSAGLVPAGVAFWSQASPGVPDSIEEGDAFGFAVALGDANGHGGLDLAVGVPGEEIDDAHPSHGAVHVIYSVAVFSDGFESGDLSGWSTSLP